MLQLIQSRYVKLRLLLLARSVTAAILRLLLVISAIRSHLMQLLLKSAQLRTIIAP